MKLKFKIRGIPAHPASRYRLGKDNIPMLNKEGLMWFLWNEPELSGKIHLNSKVYSLKKIG
ncbi:hypothetical protein LCGC14_1984280 [marine sediment metagenome]|uniref:Uncharacterized protein n=1 Tax=marine sediment metagenome TaxID=412755 RepID=A0A0F9F864_9ZZZZ